MAQSNQSAQAVESVEKTRGGEEGCQGSINPSGQNRYDFHGNQDNRNQAHDVSCTARTTATKATTAVRSARTSKAAATKSATAKASRFGRQCSTPVLNKTKLNSLRGLYNDHDAFDALVELAAAIR